MQIEYSMFSVTSINTGAKHMRCLNMRSESNRIDTMPQLAPYAKNWYGFSLSSGLIIDNC